MDLTPTLSVVLPWVVILFQGCLIFVLLRQQGRTLLAQQELQDRLTATEGTIHELGERLAGIEQGEHGNHGAPRALPIGSPAPAFVATDLEGRERTLQEFLGEPLLLVFFSPSCGFCRQMAPRLSQLPEGAPRVLLVSEGDPAEHRRMADEHHWRCDVLLQQDWAVSNAFHAGGTPTGYLLDAEGRIASGLAIGADALLRLVSAAPAAGSQNGHQKEQVPQPVPDEAQATEEPPAVIETAEMDRPAEVPSEPKRPGLPAGTPAPAFRLPDLDGTSHELEEFRGKRVLLVFSEPECAPCQPLAKELARRERRNRLGDLQVVMISRGDPETNRERAREHGIRFPVLLQERYEVAKEYAMFATPVAYLIDEQGTIAKDVAIGPDAILQLA